MTEPKNTRIELMIRDWGVQRQLTLSPEGNPETLYASVPFTADIAEDSKGLLWALESAARIQQFENVEFFTKNGELLGTLLQAFLELLRMTGESPTISFRTPEKSRFLRKRQ